MLHVMLNPPKRKGKKKKKGAKAKGRKKAASRKKKGATKKRKGASKKKKPKNGRRTKRVCMPRVDLRYAKSLRKIKRKVLKKLPKKKTICIPTRTIASAKNLKTLKRKLLGVKYGFAKRPYVRPGTGSSVVPGPTITPRKKKPAAKAAAPRKTKARKARKGGKKLPGYKRVDFPGPGSYYGMYTGAPSGRRTAGKKKRSAPSAKRRKKVTYEEYIGMLPLERKMAGIRKKDIVAANPRERGRNFPLPMYALNQSAVPLNDLRNGLTAGYRPRAMKAAIPLLGGLVGNGILSRLTGAMVNKQFTISDKWKNPVGLAVGLGTAGVIGAVTRMAYPQYAGKVFLGAMTQVAWDAYQHYVAPAVNKALNLEGWGGDDLSFGLWCPECEPAFDLTDYYPRPSVGRIPATVDRVVGTVMPQEAVTTQAPPNVSAPVPTAKVNGKTVEVERIPGGKPSSPPPGEKKGEGINDFLIQPQVAGAVPSPMGGFLDPYQKPGMGDFLTPNQVANATALGDVGDMSSYL